jgi:hypothetical protein
MNLHNLTPATGLGTVRIIGEPYCLACGRSLRSIPDPAPTSAPTVKFRRCQYEGLVHAVAEIPGPPLGHREFNVAALGYDHGPTTKPAPCEQAHRVIAWGATCMDCGEVVGSPLVP